MKKYFDKKLFFLSLVTFLLMVVDNAWADHRSCPDPVREGGLAWCVDVSHFSNGLCVAEPLDFQEINHDVVCLLGKIDPEGMENLVDFTASLAFQPSNQFEALLEIDPAFFAPEIDSLIPEEAVPGSPDSNGEFQTLLILPRQGQYNLKIQTRSIRDGLLNDGVAIKKIVRLSAPHLTVLDARGKKGEQSVGDFSLTEQPAEGMEMAPAHSVTVTPPSGGNAMDAIEFCLKTDDPPAEHPGHEGSELEFFAVNRITDSSGDDRREVTIRCTPTNGICSATSGTGEFCEGGRILAIPMGNGTNEIEINVTSSVDSERIVVAPIQNDLKGPTLCVDYLDSRGNSIPQIDGKVLLPTEAEEVMIDVSYCGDESEEVTVPEEQGGQIHEAPEPPRRRSSPMGRFVPAWAQIPATTGVPTTTSIARRADLFAGLGRCNPENPQPDSEGTWPVLIKRQNEPEFLKMCAVEKAGRTHFQARFRHLEFPINTLTIKAKDNAGNETLETHSFLFGNVRSLFGREGHLDLAKALVPKGVGGFLKGSYLTGELKEVLLKVLNSDKFKNELLPDLLDPRQPGLEEQECLQGIEGIFGSEFNHMGDYRDNLGDAKRIVAMKLFCDDGECGGIGDFSIPYFHLLNDNRIWLQLKLRGFEGRAEVYTMEFINTDGDGRPGGDDLVDTEDDDDDADGILDEDDPDDDNDRVPDERDLPGRLVSDPDYSDRDDPNTRYPDCSPNCEAFILPVKLNVRELALNLALHLTKGEDDRLRVEVSNIPGRPIVAAIPRDKLLVEFDCTKDISELFQGGRAGDPGNGLHPRLTRRNKESCYGLQADNNALLRLEDDLIDFGIGRAEKDGTADPKKRATQSTNAQLRHTLEASLSCSVPKRLEASLKKFETEKVTAISQELMDRKFNFDFFSPLGKSDLFADPTGVGFSGGGVLLPAGVTSPEDESEKDASEFLADLPDEFHHKKFGPVFETEVPEEEQVDPIEAAYGTGGEIGLVLKEETINSLLHAVNVQLFDLNRQEDEELARGEISGKTLDTFARKLREENGLGIPDVGGTECLDKNNVRLDLETNWKCFPFALSLSVLLGDDTLNYADLDGDGVFNPALDPQIPVLIRTTLNRFAAPTVKLVNVSAPSDTIFAEMEVGLPPLRMALFEEQFVTATFINPETGQPESARRGIGRIKSWCESDRFPGMDPARCSGERQIDSPIAVFEATGRVSVTLMINRADNGILRISAGITSQDSPTGPLVDAEKSFLRVTTVENNTLAADRVLARTFENNMNTILGKFLFGSARTISLKVPTMVPLLRDRAHPAVETFCQRFPGEIPEICDCEENPDGPDCDNVGLIQQTWDDLDLDEDFGIAGLELQDPLIGLAGPGDGSPRYLTVGIGTCLKDEEGHCIGGED